MSASMMPRGLLSWRSCAIAFLKAAVAHHAKFGIRIERVMTDNGSCYRSKAFRSACKRLDLRRLTKPTRPRPMARPSASSKPHCENGPTLVLIRTQISEPSNCSTGSIATIGIGHMVA
jgi:Integrase core domain